MSAIMEPENQNSYLSKAQALLNNFIGGLLNPAGGPNVPITAGGGVPGETSVEEYRQRAIERENLRRMRENQRLQEQTDPLDLRSTWPRMAPMPEPSPNFGMGNPPPVEMPEYRHYGDLRFLNSVPVPMPDIRDKYTYEQLMR